jgi:3-oxoacyl-[acyl-carrier protein] reductase
MVAEVLEAYGTVDVLVNNAVRNFLPAKFLGLPWEEVQKDIDVIARGAFHCCQEVIPVMLRQGGGKIINLSTVATENPPPEQVKYVVAKSALVGLTRSLAAEFASRNIQVNMVVPGFVDTGLVSHISQVGKKKIAEDTPMRRIATPVDVAHAAVFLASSFSSFTTGQKFLVTGGGAPYL